MFSRAIIAQQTLGTRVVFTENDIQEIVNAHNFFRSIVVPPASNMQQITWSSRLARVAQNYAERCIFGPNPNRTAQAAGPSFNEIVGENRAFGRTTNYTELIERGWFVQQAIFNFDLNMCLSPGACDEYTQLVWAETNMVGCGAANCPTVQGLSIMPNTVAFVCNYAPGGNIAGMSPYMTGFPCSNCPPDLAFCVNNTCSSVDNAVVTTTPTPVTPVTPRTVTPRRPRPRPRDEDDSRDSSDSDSGSD